MNGKIAIEAAAFYKIGNDLLKDYVKNPPQTGTKASVDDMVIFPIIINLAFACELFLKSTLTEKELKKARRNKKGHKLRYLYNHQDESMKRLIKSKLVKKYNVSERWFDTELDKASNTFYEWRYYYEKKNGMLSVSISFLQYMCEFFYEIYRNEFETK